MAVSMGFDILFATLIPLYLIPCSILFTHDLLSALKLSWEWYTKPLRIKSQPASEVPYHASH
jgi:hypothetical protein